MKIPMPCHQCSPIGSQWVVLDIRNDDRYTVSCPNGHTYEIWLQNLKFEILFETGAIALIQGYYIESVAAMHASLERFYEFCVRVILRKYGIDFKDIDDTWKNVRRQSERQLGAFVFLHLLETGAAQKIDEQIYKFRNDVLHNGYMPSYDEVFRYGETVYNHITTVLKGIKERAGESFWEVIIRNQPSGEVKTGAGALCMSTTIQHARADLGQQTFQEALSELKNDRMPRHYEI